MLDGCRKACDDEYKGILWMWVMLLSGVIPGRSASGVEAMREVKNIDIFISQNRYAAGARVCAAMCFCFLCCVVRIVVWRLVCPNVAVSVLFGRMLMSQG